jgi:hypothetical protein
MKVWEALAVLQQIDGEMEVVISFPLSKAKKPFPWPGREDVINKEWWIYRTHPVETEAPDQKQATFKFHP